MKTSKHVGVKETKTPGTSDAGVMKRVVAACLLFLASVFVLSEVMTFCMWGLPSFCVYLFQSTGIGVTEGLTVAEFSVQDFCVMFMMWIVPCLFLLGITLYLHCKLLKHYSKYAMRWLHVIVKKKHVNQ